MSQHADPNPEGPACCATLRAELETLRADLRVAHLSRNQYEALWLAAKGRLALDEQMRAERDPGPPVACPHGA